MRFCYKKTGGDGRPSHVNEDDDEGECSTDREGGGKSGGDSLSNGKVSDGSGTEDSGRGADQFTPSEEWLRDLKATQHWGVIFLRNQKPPIFDGQAIELSCYMMS